MNQTPAQGRFTELEMHARAHAGVTCLPSCPLHDEHCMPCPHTGIIQHTGTSYNRGSAKLRSSHVIR